MNRYVKKRYGDIVNHEILRYEYITNEYVDVLIYMYEIETEYEFTLYILEYKENYLIWGSFDIDVTNCYTQGNGLRRRICVRKQLHIVNKYIDEIVDSVKRNRRIPTPCVN